MLPGIADALLPIARRLDPERAHRLALRALRLGLAGASARADDPILQVHALGLTFPNPVGLAAGLDKDAEALSALAGLGFGFLEAGTVTPRPQPGNPRPRLFRLNEDRAVINRMGFNGKGVNAFVARLRADRPGIPIGANLGINKQDADPERDYPALVAAIGALADYLVVNVSSPNTPGLRDLQAEARLAGILAAIQSAAPEHPPLLVKIAPDLSADGLKAVIGVCVEHAVRGLIVSNTTTARPPGLRSVHAGDTGGLSGVPLFGPSTVMLARARLLAGERLCLVGVGGIFSGADALAKIMAGASLVQLYTALVYEGPRVVRRITAELATLLRARGFSRVEDAVGIRAAELADGA